MTRSERFVLDTNVLISALAFLGSTPRKAFDLAIA
jgi:predicted nucleic acid-binding protein